MANLSQVKTDSNWGEEAPRINENFNAVNAELTQLKSTTSVNIPLFASVSEAQKAITNPYVGKLIFIGSTLPAPVYKWNGTAWENTGIKGGNASAPLENYYTKTEIDQQNAETEERFEEQDKKFNELNISNLYKTQGIDGTNRYTLAGAIAQVPAEYRAQGLKVSFVNESDIIETWEYTSTEWNVSSFTKVGAKKLFELEQEIRLLNGAFIITENLYTNKLNVNGYIIDNTGKLVKVNGEISYQPVEPSTEYVFRGFTEWSPSSVGLLGFCNSTKEIVSTVDFRTLEDYKNGKVFTTPQNTAFVLFNVLVLGRDIRDKAEFYKGKDTVPETYIYPLVPNLAQQNKEDLENFKKEQTEINNNFEEAQNEFSISLSENTSFKEEKEFGDYNPEKVFGNTDSQLQPITFWNQWVPLDEDCIIKTIKLNPKRIDSITSWNEGLNMGIAIAKKLENEDFSFEVVNIIIFPYTSSSQTIDVSELKIVIPKGFYALLSSTTLGTDSQELNRSSYGYQKQESGKTFYFKKATIGKKSDTFTGGVLKYDYSFVVDVLHPLPEKVKENSNKIATLESQKPEDKANEVNVNDITDVMFVGSSLTDSYYQPKSTSWIERLNDMVDVAIVNNAISGYNLQKNMEQLTNNSSIKHDSGNTPQKLNPKYIWWNNSANGTPTGNDGFIQLLNALEITESYGAKMILGSEEDYASKPKAYEDTYKAFSAEYDIPYSPMIQIWRKCYPKTNPYKGWLGANHSGYRASAPYNIHRDLLSKIPIEKNIKMFKVRPTYKNGSPTIDDLAYDTIEQRLTLFTSISSGATDSTDTAKADNLDDSSYNVSGGSNNGISLSEISMMKRLEPVTFNKWGLVEFILDNTCITKGIFEINSDIEPLGVYLAVSKNSSTSYTETPRTTFVKVEHTYSLGIIKVDILREDYDIQLFDKVRIIINASGNFKLSNPRFHDYDGKKKPLNPNYINGYHYRRFGKELMDKTSFPQSGHGWVLSGGAAIKSLPAEIANYTDYNVEKSHLQLDNDSSYATKTISLDGSYNKVAVRIVACIWAKLATTRFEGTDIADSEYIDASKPSIIPYDYDYGNLILTINENIIRKSIVMQGWFEIYFEIDINPTDTELKLKIERKCFVDESYVNADKPILIHDVSVQAIWTI